MSQTGCGIGIVFSHFLAKKLGPENSQSGIQVNSQPGFGSTFSFLVKNQNPISEIHQYYEDAEIQSTIEEIIDQNLIFNRNQTTKIPEIIT